MTIKCLTSVHNNLCVLTLKARLSNGFVNLPILIKQKLLYQGLIIQVCIVLLYYRVDARLR